MKKTVIIVMIGVLLYFLWKQKKDTGVSEQSQVLPGGNDNYADTVLTHDPEPSLVDPVSSTNQNIAALAPVHEIVNSDSGSYSQDQMPANDQILYFLSRPQDPAGQQRLILQLRTADSQTFAVGDNVRLSGSSLYPGVYNIWYDYSGVSPVYGPVRNLYLDTIYKGSESGVTIVKA